MTGRIWIGRAVLVVLIPLLVLGLAELVLRLIGYGFPPRFLIPARIEGRRVWVDNQRFGWRFFNPEIARSPEPIVLRRPKPEGTFRIFLLGDSAAQGDPDTAYSPARLLDVVLRAQYPGVRFEVVNAAMTAINSHVVRLIAQDCARFEPDLFVVYMGNNEVIGPYGPGTVFQAFSSSLAYIRSSIALRGTRVGQWVAALAGSRAPNPMGEWRGMAMFLDRQVRHDDPQLQAVYRHYERNLNDIARAGRRAGARVLLCTLSVNLRDCPPFGSLHRPDLQEGEDAATWRQEYDAGASLEARGQLQEALERFEAAADQDEAFADLAFRRARCAEALGGGAAARSLYQRALDLDTLRFRSDSVLREVVVRNASGTSDSDLRLFDVARLMDAASANGIPGRSLFYDHVHFTFHGNYLLARALAEAMAPDVPAWVAAAGARGEPAPSEEDCARRLGYAAWSELNASQSILKRVTAPPFINQLDHPRLVRYWEGRVRELSRQVSDGGMDHAEQFLRDAMAETPDDWMLHEQLAVVLRGRKDYAGAAEQYREVLALIPHREEAALGLAVSLAALNRVDDALACLTSRRLQARIPRARACVLLGNEMQGRGRYDTARMLFERAIELDPRHAEAHNNLGTVLSMTGRRDAAGEHFRTAIALDPRHANALNNVGAMLLESSRAEEAAPYFQRALGTKPYQAELRCNLARALAAQGKTEEAVREYRAALEFRPDSADVYLGLGATLVNAGRAEEAVAVFDQGLLYQPDDVHLNNNLGGVLMTLNRDAEAARYIRRAAEIAPSNASVQLHMRTLQSRKQEAARE